MARAPCYPVVTPSPERGKPRRTIVSQTAMPEYMLPGQPLTYASTWTEGAFPYGMLVKTVDGRPIKIDGNPAHPVAGGGSNAAMQATLLTLYDPDRLAQPTLGAPWERRWERRTPVRHTLRRPMIQTGLRNRLPTEPEWAPALPGPRWPSALPGLALPGTALPERRWIGQKRTGG